LRLEDFGDGLAETALVATGPTDVPWTKPADLPWSDKDPLPAPWHESSLWWPGVPVVCADGTVRTVLTYEDRPVPGSTNGFERIEDWRNLRAMMTRNAGDRVNLAKAPRFEEAAHVPPDEPPVPIPSLRGRLQGHWRRVNGVAFSPDGKTVASASDDGTLRLWDAANGQILTTLITHERLPVRSVAFSPDGKTLVSGEHRYLCLWDAVTRFGIGTLQEDRAWDARTGGCWLRAVSAARC
jgi:hypothetical protein